jgi:MOSC domain-containing protein YiiM
MLVVVSGRPGRVIGVGMVVTQNLKTPGPRVLLHPQLVDGIDEEAVALGFSGGVVNRQQFLRPCRVIAEVLQRHNLAHLFADAIRSPQHRSTALLRIILGGMLANGLHLRVIQLERHGSFVQNTPHQAHDIRRSLYYSTLF